MQTKDAGTNWSEMETPHQIIDIFFPTQSIGYAVGYNGAILKITCQGVDLSFIEQPIDQIASSGDEVMFSINSNSSSAVYQWQTDFGLGFQDLIDINKYFGVNSGILKVSNLSVANHGQPFRAKASVEGCTKFSNISILSISDTIAVYDTITYYDTTYVSVTDTLIINIETTGAVPENKEVITIKVYPNPASSYIVIDNGSFNSISNHTIEILNDIGQQVFYHEIDEQYFEIDISSIGSKGLYILSIKF